MAEDWSSGWADAERNALLVGASMTPAARFDLLCAMQDFAWKAGAYQREIEIRLRAVDQLWEGTSNPPGRGSGVI